MATNIINIIDEYEVVKKYHDKPEFPEIVKLLKLGNPKKNYTDNLVYNGLPVCNRCKIRHVSRSSRKTCDHCTPIGGTPITEESQCATVYKRSKDGLSPGSRCNQHRLKGSKYCKIHASRGGGRRRFSTKPGRFNVSRFYRHLLTDTLQTRFEELSKAGHKEILDLKDEVILAKTSAEPKVKAYNDLVRWFERNEEKIRLALASDQVSAEDKATLREQLDMAQSNLIQVSTQMQEALFKVCTITEKANTVYQKHVETVEVGEIHIVVEQIIKIMYDVCGPQYKWLAEDFDRRVKTEVALPGKLGDDGPEGSSANTDLLIQQMLSQSVGLPDYEDNNEDNSREETNERRNISYSEEPGDSDS